MARLAILIVGTAFWAAASVCAYQVTNYFEPSLSPTTYVTATSNDRSVLVLQTVTAFVTRVHTVFVPSTVTPSPITAGTSVTEQGRMTIVSALLPTGIGSAPNTAATTAAVGYYVQLTYTACQRPDAGGHFHPADPITTLASVPVPFELSGHLSPTSTNTSIGVDTSKSATTTYTRYQGVVDPSAIEPIDLAAASYRYQPTGDLGPTCFRATTPVDYRGYCGYMSAQRTTTATTSTRNCGEMNPCCYGCHGWGKGFVVAESVDMYICEDGRNLYLNGSEMSPSAPQNINNQNPNAGAETRVGALFLVVSMVFVVVLLS